MSQRLRETEEIHRILRCSKRATCFINPSVFTLLGLDGQGNSLQFIVRHDSFGGSDPAVFTPSERWSGASMGIVETNNRLLEHPEVSDHLKSLGPNPGALFLMFDEETEALCTSLGVELLSPPASLRNRLDDKVETVRIGNRAGVGSVPNYLGPVTSYNDLLQTAHQHDLGDDLVVQTPYGDSGHTTFFVSGESDWDRIADPVRRESAVKVMKRIRCRSFTQEACLTRWGTLIGPLQHELIGLPELTSDRGGWCGNELAVGPASRDLELRARSYTRKLAEQLGPLGFRGCFDVDYLVDLDSGALYLGELNPRVSGATPLTTLSCAASGQLPLVLFHLLEYRDVDLDLTSLLDRQQQQAVDAPWSSLIVKCRSRGSARVTSAPCSGIWKRQASGSVSYDRPGSRSLAHLRAGEAFVQCVARPGLQVQPGDDLARIIVRETALTSEDRLNDRARSWAQAVENQIVLEQEATWQ